VKNKLFKNTLVAGVAGIATFGAVNITTAQDLPAPKDVAAAPADAEKTDSGLMSKVLKKGTGAEKPLSADTVTVHYSGWTLDGKMFDSSVKRGQPSSFPLNGVIKGWTEGLQLMVEGEKRRFWIPADLAYGENPGDGRPGGMLCFDVELLKIKKAPVAPKVPEDVAAAPADAEKTDSGLQSRVLKKGTGTEKPKATDKVTVHYSGWDKTGKRFDSSVMRGEPASFPLSGVIKGWTEGLQLMVVGEKRRFWIPADLAYGENPGGGRPSGDLCFDIELFEFAPAPQLPEVPKNISEVPADAIESEGGVKSIVIKEGKGATPEDTDVLMMNYTGWDKHGKVMDTSVQQGEAIHIPLGGQMSSALKAGIKLMKPGEIRQFWIPAKHIVGDTSQPGLPEGPYCYQFEYVELFKVK